MHLLRLLRGCYSGMCAPLAIWYSGVARRHEDKHKYVALVIKRWLDIVAQFLILTTPTYFEKGPRNTPDFSGDRH